MFWNLFETSLVYFHQVLTGAVDFLVIAFTFAWTWFTVWKYTALRHDLTTTYYVVSLCLTNLGILILIYTLWRKQNDILEFITLASTPQTLQCHQRSKNLVIRIK